jgi:mannonate dehydratase
MAWLINPCRIGLPDALAQSVWLARVWQGLDPAEVWDCHTHLVGLGDNPDSGVKVSAKLFNPLYLSLYLQRLFYMNGACVTGSGGTVDEQYVLRLQALIRDLPAGVKLMLLAFDCFHDDSGKPHLDTSTFHVPDAYARRVAAESPHVFEWVASIHPYRPDAIDRLQAAAEQGARAIKWLPAAQNIDPDSPRCAAFYALLARLDLPLIIHCGKEEAVESRHLLHFGNPLRLRRMLAAGVRVVVAHCATSGYDEDMDNGGRRVPSFDLFARLMNDPTWEGRLFGDISAITLRNRRADHIRMLLLRTEWHGRLLNGSDYPLPGILPLISPRGLARAGLLPAAAIPDLLRLREYNALYYDLAIKRLLSWQSHVFSPQVFATRAFFSRPDRRQYSGRILADGNHV